MLAGCSIGPEYERPAVATPEAWQGQQPGAGSVPAAEWWRGFQAPQLDGLMEQAIAVNFDVAAALARVRQAEAQLKIVGGPLLPTVNATVNPSRQSNPPIQHKAGSQYNNFLVGFAASYELDLWGKNADAVEAAKAGVDASRFDRETTTLTVQANVAATYFNILALRDRIKFAKENLAVAEHTLDAFRARADAGTASGLDVAQQETLVAEQRATIPPLVQQLRQSTYALALLVGRLPEEVAVPVGTLDAISLPAVGAGLPSELLARRPDVQFAEAQLVAANANLKQAHALIYPSISLTGQDGIESAALRSLFTPGALMFGFGANLLQPIFQNGALEGGIQLREARYDELVQTYRKAVVSAFQDVESGLVGIEMTVQQEVAQRLAVETAHRAYEIAEAQLFGGTIDIVTMLNTQRTLFQAEDLLVQAKQLHAQAVLALFKAMGGGWRRPE